MSIVEVSSKDGINPIIDHSNFTVKLTKHLNNVIAVQLLQATIPFSWYIINDSNNTFNWSKTDSTNVNTIIPEGSYSSHQIAETLSNQMSLSGQNISVEYDSATDKFTFTSSTVFTIQPMNDQLKKILGYDVLSAPTPATSISTNKSPMVTGDNCINLSIENLFLDVQSTSNLSNSTIQIPITSNPRGVIYYQNADEDDVIPFQVDCDLSELKIRLSYFDGAKLGGSKNFRGVPCFFKFKFFFKK